MSLMKDHVSTLLASFIGSFYENISRYSFVKTKKAVTYDISFTMVEGIDEEGVDNLVKGFIDIYATKLGKSSDEFEGLVTAEYQYTDEPDHTLNLFIEILNSKNKLKKGF